MWPAVIAISTNQMHFKNSISGTMEFVAYWPNESLPEAPYQPASPFELSQPSHRIPTERRSASDHRFITAADVIPPTGDYTGLLHLIPAPTNG